GDTTFPLQIHIIEHLCLQIPFGNGLCILQKSIGQGAFSVIDVGDDAKIPNMFHKGAQR
ncbi:MAG: hypothetical protein RL090_1091, partial [Bacteroidota bacterium]